MRPWRKQLLSSPSLPPPAIRWCWPRAEFSISEDACAGAGRGELRCDCRPLELFSGINVLGGLLLFYPPPLDKQAHTPALPPSKTRCLDLLIAELSTLGSWHQIKSMSVLPGANKY